MAFQGKEFTPEMRQLVVNLKAHFDEEKKSGKTVPTKNSASFISQFTLSIYTDTKRLILLSLHIWIFKYDVNTIRQSYHSYSKRPLSPIILTLEPFLGCET